MLEGVSPSFPPAGGGVLESTKAEQLSGWLDVPVTEQQVSKQGGGEEGSKR